MNLPRARSTWILAGLAWVTFAADAEAGSWSVSIGGYGSGYHYSLGYSDWVRPYRRHHGSDWYVAWHGLPRRHGYWVHHGHGPWYHGGHYRGYRHGAHVRSAPVVVVRDVRAPRHVGSRRYDGEVRYYDRPQPRRGYDRVGYGDRYSRPDTQRRDYRDVHDAALRYDYDDIEGREPGRTGRIDRY